MPFLRLVGGIRPGVGVLVATLLLSACEAREPVFIDPSLAVDLDAMTRTPSGLLVRDLEDGSGAAADSGSVATVGYSGYFESGEMFDSGSFSFTVGTGQVVAGFDEGVQGMKVGGRRQLVVPPALGYGSQDMGPIPGGSTLVFIVDLERVER